MESVCKYIKFDNKNEMAKYFKNLFEEMNKAEEFNIYVHQVNDFHENDTRHLKKRTLIKHRVAAILKTGLKLHEYSTLTGTTQLVGNTSNICLKNLFDYNYYKCANYKALCIYAIPKYIEIDGQQVEFSSYKGLTAYDFPEELKEVYQKYSGVPVRHHFKCSLFDAIKEYDDMPIFYNLGVLQFENGVITFVKTSPHLYEMDEESRNLHDETMAKKAKNLFEKYETNSLEEVIVKSYLEEESWRDEQNMMDI